MENKQVKNIIIIILTVLVLVLIGYIIGSSLKTQKSKENNQENNVSEKYEEVSKNDKEVKDLINRVSLLHSLGSMDFDSQYYYYNKDRVKVEDMDDKLLIRLAYSYAKEKYEDKLEERIEGVTCFYLDEKYVKEAYEETFGNKRTYKPMTVHDVDGDEDVFRIEYIEKEKKYKIYTGAGFDPAIYSYEAILGAKKYSDRIEIETVIGHHFTKGTEEEQGLYKTALSFEEATDKTDIKIPENLEENGIEKLIEENQNKFNHYKYTFAKENNNYYFSSVEKIK